jgi:uncharacterized protein with PIN domain
MPKPFGATDSLTCPKCKKHLMDLTRRTPHRVRGHDFEMQTFTCRVCTKLRETPTAWARSHHDNPTKTTADALVSQHHQDDIER